MANTVLDLRTLVNDSTIDTVKLTPSTEVYTDISLVSKFSVNSVNTALSQDFLKEEQSLDDVIVDEKDKAKLQMVTDNQKYIKHRDDHTGFKVSKSINVKAVQNAIENIFNFIPGERILYPEFGSRIRYYLYEGITARNVEQLIAEINTSFLKFDERVIVDDIKDVSEIADTDDNTVVLRITYHIKDLPLQYYTYDYSYVRPIE